MSLYVNFYNNGYANPYQPQVTSMAMGEEGGGNQPQQQQPTQNTPNNDLVTTLAMGEEGGEAGFQTNEILSVLQKADGGLFQPGDGQLTRQELDSYASTVDRQVSILKNFDQMFPWLGLGSFIGNLERQSEAARFMQTNYDKIANADGNVDSMTAEDVQDTAAKDGNPDNLTLDDLQQDPPPAPEERPQNTIEMMLLTNRMDADRDGQLSRDELGSGLTQMQDRLTYLEGIRTLVFDPRLAAEIARLKKDIEAANVIDNHYDQIAKADEQFPGGNPASVSQLDILWSASRDGNIFQLDPNELPPLA